MLTSLPAFIKETAERADFLTLALAQQGYVRFTRQFRMIDLHLPRQVGKTSFIYKTADRDDLVIVPSEQAIKAAIHNGCKGQVTTEIDLTADYRRGGNIRYVFIDEPQISIRRWNVDALIKVLQNNNPACYILLGTNDGK